MSSTKNDIIITSDGSHTMTSSIYGETYHSTHGAITESQHVFIKSGLEYFKHCNNKKNIHIFEMGMGTGLNVLLSCLQANSMSNIEYTTIEKHPLSNIEIQKLNYISQLENSKSIFTKIHDSKWNKVTNITPYFKLTKLHTDLESIELETRYDIIFYDAFGPRTQGELWKLDIMQKIYNALLPNGVFVTYSAMGQLKRDLRTIGYEVQSIPGPPGKREMTRAIKKH